MGGVDYNDQVTRLKKQKRKKKWYTRLVIKLFLYSSYLVHKHLNPNEKVDHPAYKEHLIGELAGFVRVRAIALDVKESWKRSVSDCKMLENISRNRRSEKSLMCSVYKEKAMSRDQYPSAKVGEPSKTTYRCSSELCKAIYLQVPCKQRWHELFKDCDTKVEFWR